MVTWVSLGTLGEEEIDQRRRNVMKAGGAQETVTNLRLLVVNYIMLFINS